MTQTSVDRCCETCAHAKRESRDLPCAKCTRGDNWPEWTSAALFPAGITYTHIDAVQLTVAPECPVSALQRARDFLDALIEDLAK